MGLGLGLGLGLRVRMRPIPTRSFLLPVTLALTLTLPLTSYYCSGWESVATRMGQGSRGRAVASWTYTAAGAGLRM